MELVKWFVGRLPDKKSILGVYAVIVILVYSWTLIVSFYQLPSWLFYLTLPQIFSIYAYSFSLNLAESLLVLAGVLFLDYTVFLALKNRDEFQARSILVVVFMLASSMTRLAFLGSYESIDVFLSSRLVWWAITISLVLLLAIFAPRLKGVRSILEGVAERAVVFLYIYPPLSLVALAVVIVRNI